MLPKMSACVFIRDNDVGAFCLWESMAQLIPLVDEYVVYDFGSTDGTRDAVLDLALKNPKIKSVVGPFPTNPKTGNKDSGGFAEMANMVVSMCKNDLVIYHQSDEIWHENLIRLMVKRLESEQNGATSKGFEGLSFWRYQLKENFQKFKWFPHLVKRVVWKRDIVEGTNPFDGDGMNTTRQADVCSHFDGGWGHKWDTVFRPAPHTLPGHEMILDVSRNGGFLQNIVKKSTLHGPFWNEDPNVDGRPVKEWYEEELRTNTNWYKQWSPFEIPEIMRGHLGKDTYEQRPEIMKRIANG